jgi:hypothetical protein
MGKRLEDFVGVGFGHVYRRSAIDISDNPDIGFAPCRYKGRSEKSAKEKSAKKEGHKRSLGPARLKVLEPPEGNSQRAVLGGEKTACALAELNMG